MQYRINPRRWTLVNVDFDVPVSCTMRSYPNKKFVRNHNTIVGSMSFILALLLFFYISPLLSVFPVIFSAVQNIYGAGTSVTWNVPTNAGGEPDGSRASEDSGNDGSILSVGTFGDNSNLGTFISARCAINLRDDGAKGNDDQLIFSETSIGGTTTLDTFTTAADDDYTEDTNLFFASTEIVSWLTLENTSLDAEINTVDGGDNFTWEVDSMFVEVTYTPPSGAARGASGLLALIHNMVFGGM